MFLLYNKYNEKSITVAAIIKPKYIEHYYLQMKAGDKLKRVRL